MSLRNTPAFVGALAIISLASVGCATKKHVREAIAPVQNQVNQTQAQVGTLQKQTDEYKAKTDQSIGDLDRQVATADEKATDAGKKAAEAAASAAQANTAAAAAAQQAQAANTLAQQTGTKLDTTIQNLDNYKLVSTAPIYFGFGKSTLNKDEQAKLDDAVQKLQGMKGYVLEVEGFADKTGNVAYNRDLSRKRADAVVHYLAVEHNIPLRSIRELGVGADFPDANNKTRDDRKENRRVDVKIYQLDVTGQAAQASNAAPAATSAQ
ncbi:MAG TPA: OmpA family protein [Bryobacteraceae bacterium]|jgi:outer membrane protein OmpA-like peptidoglycan-associated protein|nr:OmpA family protein [Bryobacteraceae bacterium]